MPYALTARGYRESHEFPGSRGSTSDLGKNKRVKWAVFEPFLLKVRQRYANHSQGDNVTVHDECNTYIFRTIA